MKFPFAIAGQVVLATLTQGTISFPISSGETFNAKQIFTDTSTALVNVVGLRDQAGRAYVLASQSAPIPIAQLVYPGKTNESNPFYFEEPLILNPQGVLYVDIYNGSGGSVTINLVVVGFKEVQ